MITDRNKCNFVTICCWLGFLLAASVALAQAPNEQQQQPQQPQQQQQLSHTPAQQSQHSPQSPQAQQPIKDDHRADSGNGNGNGSGNGDGNALTDAAVHAFSPRVDYNNEWRPVGRGDPLKNDPTFDYSPPALDHVRYWADTKDGKDDKEGGAAANKESSSGERGLRKSNASKNEVMLLGMPSDHYRGTAHAPMHAHKNAKGETPLLQPKYTSVRRSYYAHQLPTRLMPPPMQTISPPAYNTMPKPTNGEHRHSMSPGHLSTASMMSMSTSAHSKPHYSTMSMSTSPWMYSAAAVAQPHTSVHRPPHMGSAYGDSHHQESAQHVSYARPSTMSSLHPHQHQHQHQQHQHQQHQFDSYAPNTIRPSPNSVKQTSYRKPWLHELLQKEVIKPVKPTMSSTKYLLGTTKPLYERMPASVGISTTFAPVAHVTTTITPPSHAPLISITSSQSYKLPHRPTAVAATTTTTTTTRHTSHTAAPTTPRAPSSTTSSRLLIPTTNNLVHRPTVAPLEMTTDSLFSHYNQPDKPLRGPMYLIIEGHSKVKKYGKNEFNLKLPKIVPIIPKREPVVRFADQNEKPGPLEAFQVKHLHTKTSTTTTTPVPPSTTSITPNLATTTTSAPMKSQQHAAKPKPAPNDPPTGMQGLLSLLDSSLSGLLAEEPSDGTVQSPQSTNANPDEKIFVTTLSTILKPVSMGSTTAKPPPPVLEARVGTNSASIEADSDDSAPGATTEPPPREVRQIYDYDQLPESRLRDFVIDGFDDGDSAVLYEDEEEPTAGDEYEDDNQQLIKRIDHLADDDDADYEETFDELELDDAATDDFELSRAQAQAA